MGTPIVIIAEGGAPIVLSPIFNLPVMEAENGFGIPVTIAENGYGIPVVPTGSVEGPPINIVRPIATGELFVGETLSCAVGYWIGTAPITYAFQWYEWEEGTLDGDELLLVDGIAKLALADGVNNLLLRQGSSRATPRNILISGATEPTFVVPADGLGKYFYCVVTATNALGTASAASNILGPMQENIRCVALPEVYWIDLGEGLPTHLVTPVVTGVTFVGEFLTTTNGNWVGTQPILHTHQWVDADANALMPGATSSTFEVPIDGVGKHYYCNVLASNSYGSTFAASNVFGPMVAVPPTVWDSAHKHAGVTLSDADMTATDGRGTLLNDGNAAVSVRSVTSKPTAQGTGRWYWECVQTQFGGQFNNWHAGLIADNIDVAARTGIFAGINLGTPPTLNGFTIQNLGLQSNGQHKIWIYRGGFASSRSSPAAYLADGEVLGLAADFSVDPPVLYARNAAGWLVGLDPAVPGDGLFFYGDYYGVGARAHLYCGLSQYASPAPSATIRATLPFVYPVPTGFKAWGL